MIYVKEKKIMGKISARDFEAKVENIEDVVIRLRTSPDTEIEDYSYKRQADKKSTIREWEDARLKSKLGDMQYDIIDGKTYKTPNKRTTMGTLRESYER
jgi:hypothetical protein